MIIYDEATSLVYVVKNCSSDGDAYMYDFKKGNFKTLVKFNISNNQFSPPYPECVKEYITIMIPPFVFNQ